MKMGKVQFLSRVGPLLLGVALMMVLASSAFALVWNHEIVDSDGDVGSYTSLALDSNNQPHISYQDNTNYDLKYARWDGSDWQIETVDSQGRVGWYTSLAIDSNNRPHISYSAYFDFRYQLKYAYWDGSNWVIQTVDSHGGHSSLALDSQGRPHIAYYDNNKILKYARWDGSNWLIEEISSNSSGSVSLALDSNDQPHVSYHQLDVVGRDYDVRYAYWNGAAWVVKVVDSKPSGPSSLKLDSNDLPHISYTVYPRGHLTYARWNGSAWIIETINPGARASLALDDDDQAHIAYYTRDGTLKYWKRSHGLSETIDSHGNWYLSLALDSNNQPHIGYYSYHDLKYSFAPVPTAVTVCASGCDHTTIQDAINAAAPDDTIEVQAGTYLENLTIDKNITLQGADQATTIIDGQAQGTVVTINPNITVRIAYVTITNGLANNGNSGTHDGGGIFNQGNLAVSRSTISRNHAGSNGAGGGIWNGVGDLTLVNSTVSDNTSGAVGGGVANSGGVLSVSWSTISDNTSGAVGGGVANSGGVLSVSGSTISDNLVGNPSLDSNYLGGGIYNSGELSVRYSTIDGNMAIDQGGGGTGAGGGIYNTEGSVAITDSTISHNLADDNGQGGGLYNTGGALAITESSHNRADHSGQGGGIYNTGGSLAIIRSTISHNVADDNGQGGGINNTEGAVRIYDSTINHNQANHNGQGGGIYNTGGALAMTNSTISNNVADDHGQGGGIHNFGASATLSVNFSTINENSASAEGGGIYNRAGTVALRNSVVANSANGGECFNDSTASGTVNDDGFNIVEDNSCGFSGGSDPQLGPLADNGGPTLTHLPEEFSPVIDNVDYDAHFCDEYSFDQRDVNRDQGAACDTGAVEFEPPYCRGLIQEAEHARDLWGGIGFHNFKIGRDSAASGGKYIHVAEGTGNNWNPTSRGVKYCFTVETAGIYKVKGWVYAETGRDNSFFVRANGSNYYLWEFPKNTDYLLDEVSNRDGDDPVQLSLLEGRHTVTISLREDGARLDKLELELIEPMEPPPAPTCEGLVAEAEEGQLTGAFVVGDDTLASGGQYIHVPEGAGNSFNRPNPDHKAEYCFNVETAGTYRLKGGIYAESGRDNSFFVKVDDAPSSYLWDFPKNTDYREDDLSDRNGADPVEVELQTGPITVTVFLREDGARLDKLELEQVTTPSEVAVNEPMARGILGSLLVNDYQGAQEPELTGIKVTLQDADTRLDEALSDTAYNETTETDYLGNYYFDDMPLGSYELTLDLPNGYLSEASEVQVTTSADEMVEQFFDLQITEDEESKIYLPLVIR